MAGAITVHQTKTYRHRGSPMPHLFANPSRLIAVAPGGQGKTTALVSLMLDKQFFRGAFSRIYIFSPSCGEGLDPVWDPVKKYIREDLGVDTEKEPCWFTEWDESHVKKLAAEHAKIAGHCKENGQDPYQALFVIDDWAESRSVMRMHDKSIICSLFLRGRHQSISTWISSQCYKLLDPVIRKNATAILLWRCRAYPEIQAFTEECGGLNRHGPKLIDEIYHLAVNDAPHSFLYVNLMEKPQNMFWIRFDGGRVRLEDLDEEAPGKIPTTDKSAAR